VGVGRVGCAMSDKKNFMVVTIYNEYETGVEFYVTREEAEKDYERQKETYEAYIAQVLS
jgi:hypothetical protein